MSFTMTMTTPDSAATTLAAVERFNDAFGRRDVDGLMAAMTDDCLFENTGPAPDGEAYRGQAAVRAFWQTFFDANPDAHFETEECFVADDRCVIRWRYEWGTGHVRGVDVFRVRDGKVAEKLAYVKG